jgi:hypothetical protein
MGFLEYMGPGEIYRMGRCPVVDNTVGVRFLREVGLHWAGGSSLGYNEISKSRNRWNVEYVSRVMHI